MRASEGLRHRQAERQMVGWAALWFIASAILAAYLLGGLSLLTVGIPMAALMVGVVSFGINRPLYVEYVFWLWFLAPFARRVLDYSIGTYTPTSLVIAAPVLAGSVAGAALVADLVRGRVTLSSPFVLPLAALLFAAATGVINNGPLAAGYDFLSWSVPITLGYLVATDTERFPAYRAAFQRAFVWGGVVLGVYGVVQFVALPAWDAFWVTESGMVSVGQAAAFQVRVFGTLNAPGPYSIAMMASVLIGLAGRRGMATGPAVVGLLLSLARGAWGACLLGLGWTVVQARKGNRLRPALALAAAVVVALPVLLFQPVTTQVQDRAETLIDLEEDGSAQARAELYITYGPQRLLSSPLGEGLGAVGKVSQLSAAGTSGLDSGLFVLPLVLGFPGMVLYGAGLVRLVGRYVWRRQPDPFLQTLSGLVIALVALLTLGNQLADFAGSLLWTSVGLTIAGRTWAAAQARADGSAGDAGS